MMAVDVLFQLLSFQRAPFDTPFAPSLKSCDEYHVLVVPSWVASPRSFLGKTKMPSHRFMAKEGVGTTKQTSPY